LAIRLRAEAAAGLADATKLDEEVSADPISRMPGRMQEGEEDPGVFSTGTSFGGGCGARILILLLRDSSGG